jgi:hypothetical protein
MLDVLSKLRGGDRRSIGSVAAVVTAVQKKPDLFKDLAAGLFDEDPVVRMRCADAMEKISLSHPEFLEPFKPQLIDLAQKAQQQELRWHMAQMIPRLKLTPHESEALTEVFYEYLKDKSKIVVTFAMQALSDLAINQTHVSARVIRAIEKSTRNGSPAIRSRGKKLLPKIRKLKKTIV